MNIEIENENRLLDQVDDLTAKWNNILLEANVNGTVNVRKYTLL